MTLAVMFVRIVFVVYGGPSPDWESKVTINITVTSKKDKIIQPVGER